MSLTFLWKCTKAIQYTNLYQKGVGPLSDSTDGIDARLLQFFILSYYYMFPNL